MKFGNNIKLNDLDNLFDEVIDYINILSGRVISILEIDGGDVHSVYELSTDTDKFYLKIRNEFCKKYGNIILDPKDIRNEKIALDLLFNMFPESFPEVLLFNENKNYFLMTDIIDNGDTFVNLLNNSVDFIDLKLMLEKLGEKLGSIHFGLLNINSSFDISDDIYYERLNVVFGDNKYSERIINELKKEDFQFIIGDISPKNIGFNGDNLPVFFDLEHFVKGNSSFDIVFLLSHIFIHLFNNENRDKLIEIFINAYTNINNIVINDLFWKIFYSCIIYRVGINPMIYNVGLTLDEIDSLKTLSEQSLNKFYINEY